MANWLPETAIAIILFASTSRAVSRVWLRLVIARRSRSFVASHVAWSVGLLTLTWLAWALSIPALIPSHPSLPKALIVVASGASPFVLSAAGLMPWFGILIEKFVLFASAVFVAWAASVVLDGGLVAALVPIGAGWLGVCISDRLIERLQTAPAS